MKILRFFLVASMVAGGWLVASCSDDNHPGSDGGGETPSNVPEAVLNEFNAKFPGATNVEWTVKQDLGYAVADFYWENTRTEAGERNHTAWFSLTDHVLDMTERDIRYANVPQAVKTAFETTAYAQAPWRTDDEVDVLKRKGEVSEVLYVISVEKKEAGKETDVDLYYTAGGVLVKEVIDSEPDEDYHEFLPQEPSGSVTDWLKQHYPDARVVDIDNEENGTEVEFIAGGLKHEALFDRSGAWKYTKTEYRFRQIDEVTEIPAAVMQTLKASAEYAGANGRVEDAEKYQSASAGVYYSFEFETRYDEDVHVYIAEDGTRLDGKPNPGGDADSGVTVEQDIEKFIAETYPGARIVERDYDDGYLEIDIIHEEVKKELLFNGRNEWVRTSWDLPYVKLPAEVTDILKREGYIPDDDEAERVETSDKSWYEVEVRKGREEYKVLVYDDGTLKEWRDD